MEYIIMLGLAAAFMILLIYHLGYAAGIRERSPPPPLPPPEENGTGILGLFTIFAMIGALLFLILAVGGG